MGPLRFVGGLGMKQFTSLVIGVLFGIALSKALATDYNTIIDMFLLRNFHLYGVIASAIVTVTVGVYIFRKIRLKDITGKPIEYPTKPAKKGLVLGSALFGVGWALSGTCPGTALTQLGEGKLTAIVTLVGIFVGTVLHSIYATRTNMPVDDTCG